MLYDIYFHNDFDGRAAAAIMLDFLRKRGDDIEHFTPVSYDLIDDWLDERFFDKHKLFKGKRNPVIIVDFPFHPQATWWFDHHGSAFRKENWRKKFRPTKFRHYDPKYKSCCGQVAAILKRDFGWKPPVYFKELLVWGDILDGALYRSARQTLELKEPALQINAFLVKSSSDPKASGPFIRLLAEQPLAVIAKRKEVQLAVREAKQDIVKASRYVKQHLEIYGNTGYIFFPGPQFAKPRFIPYFQNPKLLFAVRIFKRNRLFHLGVGQNPWHRKENHFDLGKMLQEYGGGGHKGVGAAEFKDKRSVVKAAKEIVERLNKK
jgi:hypothetical protein